MRYHLHRWSVGTKDPWGHYLNGWRDQEAKAISTSHIISVNVREITTNSGTIYILEDISPEYLNFLNDIGVIYDFENPIKIKGK